MNELFLKLKRFLKDLYIFSKRIFENIIHQYYELKYPHKKLQYHLNYLEPLLLFPMRVLYRDVF